MKIIYICHPCANDIEGNRKKVIKIAEYIINKGMVPIASHLLFSEYKDDRHRKEIMQVSLHLIDICDEVWIFGESAGCKQEEAYAKKKGKTLVYFYERESFEDIKRLMEEMI